jgi:hypothetical protein
MAHRQDTKLGSERPFKGPEPAWGTSMGAPRERTWTGQRLDETLEFLKWTQTGRGTHAGALCQRNGGAVKIK